MHALGMLSYMPDNTIKFQHSLGQMPLMYHLEKGTGSKYYYRNIVFIYF